MHECSGAIYILDLCKAAEFRAALCHHGIDAVDRSESFILGRRAAPLKFPGSVHSLQAVQEYLLNRLLVFGSKLRPAPSSHGQSLAIVLLTEYFEYFQ